MVAWIKRWFISTNRLIEILQPVEIRYKTYSLKGHKFTYRWQARSRNRWAWGETPREALFNLMEDYTW